MHLRRHRTKAASVASIVDRLEQFGRWTLRPSYSLPRASSIGIATALCPGCTIGVLYIKRRRVGHLRRPHQTRGFLRELAFAPAPATGQSLSGHRCLPRLLERAARLNASGEILTALPIIETGDDLSIYSNQHDLDHGQLIYLGRFVYAGFRPASISGFRYRASEVPPRLKR